MKVQASFLPSKHILRYNHANTRFQYGGEEEMKPLQISAETAQKLAAQLQIPIEHLMHMPQHILMQKLVELSKKTDAQDDSSS